MQHWRRHQTRALPLLTTDTTKLTKFVRAHDEEARAVQRADRDVLLRGRFLEAFCDVGRR